MSQTLVKNGVLILGMLTLVACQPDNALPVGDGPGPQACKPARYEGLVGAQVAAITLPADLEHRIIGPDTMVTMDYVPERLNIHTDKNGRVLRISCG